MTVSEMRPKANDASDDGGRGARDWLNKHPGVVIGAIVGLLVLLALFWTTGGPPEPQLYYTVDDGKTFFADKRQATPFMKDGKEAVQAMVFTCGAEPPFVGYLLRWPPGAREKYEAHIKNPQAAMSMPPGGEEVKRVGEKEWVAAFDMRNMTKELVAKHGGDPRKAIAAGGRYNEIKTVKCPDGKGVATPVYPPNS